MQQNFVIDTSRITGVAGYVPNKHDENWSCVSVCLALAKKRISPMNCLSRFSRRQRMEAKYYKDIIHDCICIDTDPGIQIHDDILVFSGQGGKLHRISTDL